MRNKAEGSEISTRNVTKLEKGMFTQVVVFLYLLMFTSAETQFRCSVTRSRFGDRFVFYDYAGTCTKGLNPCKRVNGVYGDTVRNCSCQCSRLNSTYREDLGFCVKNKEIREECTLLFNREQDTQSLRVFNNSSSIKLKTIPRENCFVTGTAYVIAYNGTVAWKQFKAANSPFLIHHEDRNKDKHDHFLRWNGGPVKELFGKIVKVDVLCRKPRGQGSDTLSKMCIMFKVRGSVNLPCPVATPSPTLMVTTGPKETQLPVSNHTTKKPPVTFTDIAIVTLEPNTTTAPSLIDSGEKELHDANKNALPIWLIAVVAGGAVIATLSITAIIWICCRMKQRSNRKRNKSTTRRRLVVDNSLYQGDEVTFAPWDGGTKTSEPGYAKVGSPSGQSKGYTCLKPTPERCRSEYQKLLKKPTEDHSGYLVPMEEVTTNTRCPLEPAIYSEAQSPKPEPPPHKPKSKEYDYAKPEDIIVLTASRSSLDNLDSYKDTNLEPNEEGYVEVRGSDSNVPSSPLYAVVEGPNSPKSPGVPSEGDLLENEPEDPPGDYIEVLPDTENENRDSKT